MHNIMYSSQTCLDYFSVFIHTHIQSTWFFITPISRQQISHRLPSVSVRDLVDVLFIKAIQETKAAQIVFLLLLNSAGFAVLLSQHVVDVLADCLLFLFTLLLQIFSHWIACFVIHVIHSSELSWNDLFCWLSAL